MAPKAKDEVTSSLAKLSIKTTELETTPRGKPQKKSSPVADSWEDEADSASDTEDPTPVASTNNAGTSAPPPTPMSPAAASSTRGSFSGGTSAPPPTPMSPVAAARRPFSPSALAGPGFTIPPFDGASDQSPPSSSGGPSKRPEKTDAVARRMIAASLGMKAPKLTEEQRAYDRAVREKEKKRKEEEKEREKQREEEAAKARQAIWED